MVNHESSKLRRIDDPGEPDEDAINLLRKYAGLFLWNGEAAQEDSLEVLERDGPTDQRLTESCQFSSLPHAEICVGHGYRRDSLSLGRAIAQRAAYKSALAMEDMVSRWA